MKSVRNILTVIFSLFIFTLLIGCNAAQSDNNTEPYETEVSTGGFPPPPFWIANTGGRSDFKSEAITQLTQAYSGLMHLNDANGNDDWLYDWNEVATLGEFYFVNVEVDGFELTGFGIDRDGVSFVYRCIEALEMGHINSRDNVLSIALRREVSGHSREELWQIISEQLTRDGRGVITEDGMIYVETDRRISARIGDVPFSIGVPDRLNSYEFLRDLALEVIATSELVVLFPPSESPVVGSWAELRDAVDAAPANTPTTIRISESFAAPNDATGHPILIPADRDITLVSTNTTAGAANVRTLTQTPWPSVSRRHIIVNGSLTLGQNITLCGGATGPEALSALQEFEAALLSELGLSGTEVEFETLVEAMLSEAAVLSESGASRTEVGFEALFETMLLNETMSLGSVFFGGVDVRAGGTLTMNEGSVIENVAWQWLGGGVTLDATPFSGISHATLNINGGIIRNNMAQGGAGVHVGPSGRMFMQAGSIEGNISTSSTLLNSGGGGVLLSTATAIFNMDGGTIYNNRTSGTVTASGGGGILLNNGRVNITAGSIIGNTSTTHGGGIRVFSTLDGALTMTGGIIENNHADIDGGGIFSTQSSDALTVPATAYRNLNIGADVLFSNNTAGNGASAPPNNRLAHIAATSSSLWDYVLNNYDINYTGRLGQAGVIVAGTWDGLRDAINAAPANTPTTIQISNSFAAPSWITGGPIVIPEGRSIILVSTNTTAGAANVRTLTQANNGQRHFAVNGSLTLGQNITLCGGATGPAAFSELQEFEAILAELGLSEIEALLSELASSRTEVEGEALVETLLEVMRSIDIEALNAGSTGSGGVRVNARGTFTMNAGSMIENCQGWVEGGAVFLEGAGTAELTRATFNMNGGTIRNNSANQGGGVALRTNSFISMNNGLITNNVASMWGGGVALNTGSLGLTMMGGRITNNRANGFFNVTGGGIFGGARFIDPNAVVSGNIPDDFFP
ncbi:MAG: hypothetical protein FWC96_07225 [Oscillospiraceae bacterium]|nr:hypothetical protein [Oscillospiraceae bacterium]